MKRNLFTAGFSFVMLFFYLNAFAERSLAGITISVEKIINTCAGSNTGAINISVTGSKGECSYNWTGPNGYSKKSKNINNLAAGIYYLTVKDAKGNTASLQVDVISLAAIIVNATVADVQCFNTSTGSIDLNVSGGSGTGYTYSWSGANGFKATTEDLSNLKAGTYNVIVTDMAGCTINKLYTVYQSSSALTTSVSKTESNICYGNGTITITGVGGTAPYWYKINNGSYASTGFFNNLIAGTYSIKTKDSKSCEVTTTVEIPDAVVDVFENNNLMSTAKEINLFFTIQAKIGPTSGDVDWYKFTTGPDMSRQFSFVLRLLSTDGSCSGDIYDINGQLIQPTFLDLPNKIYYNLNFSTTYYIKVTGQLSNTCYNLLITAPIESPLALRKFDFPSEIQNQTAKIFPNPHSGSFTLNIESPLDGIATIEIYNANGQKLNTQKQAVVKGKSIIASYQNMKGAVLFYKIIIGNKQLTGKIIGTN